MDIPEDKMITNSAGLERARRELSVQRRVGIKVKLEFDSPQWWTEEFIRYTHEVATQKMIAAAKKYVRSGSVIELVVNPGVVEAKVQGSRKAPYNIRLYSPLPTDDRLAAIKQGLSERAVCGAMLLAGEMPREVGDVFRSAGVGLVPQDYSKSRMLCSCPEPDSVCKHIVAVLLVITDAFDRDPFLLLRMRGLDKEDLVASLTDPRGKVRRTKRVADTSVSPVDLAREDAGSERETGQIETAYAPMGLRELLAQKRPRARTRYAPPSPIFDFPLWRGETSFSDSIRPYYESVRKIFR